MILAACGPTTPPPTTEPQKPAATGAPAVAAPAATDAPTEAPAAAPSTTRHGGWADTIVYTSIDQASDAIAQLSADALDMYPYGTEDADAFEATKADPKLTYNIAIGGSVDGYMFNPNGPKFTDGRLNPFSSYKVREALNWLIDRKYLCQEAVGALAMPQTVVIPVSFPDYVRYVDLIRPLEAKYAYNFDKAKEAISAEMQAMGATQGADGKWQANGKPVVLIGLIRSEDERTFLGNYLSDQLEKLGFTVDRQIRTRSELSPIWGQSVPAEGKWHFYTGGWGYSSQVRNSSNLFDSYYTPRAGSTTTEQAYVNTPEFDKLSLDLANNVYANMDERREKFGKAFEMSLAESEVVWVMTINSFYPRREGVEVATDLVASVGQTSLYPYTLRWKGKEGGTIRSASQGILTGAWNPVSGQNWVQETVVQSAVADFGVLPDPYTGLYWPQRMEKAEVVVKEGLPMTKTLDWVDLKTAAEIKVPADAWADWDAKNQKFITVGEKYPEGTTALTKTTVYYPSSLWQVKWHDGSTMSAGDFVVNMIQTFDRAKPESPIYDEAALPRYESMMSIFKGVKIVSTDPLVIETYLNSYDLDAEVLVGNYTYVHWFPIYTNGGTAPFAWHSFVPGMLAEQNKELGFSQEKSTALNVTWTHYVDGPSLDILKKYLDQAETETFLPYAPTVSQYITADEAKARYANLQTWYGKHKNFWVGTGPYYLDQVNSVEGSIVVKTNPEFPDLSNKWAGFGEPMMPVMDATGPLQVTIGQEAAFDVLVSFKDAPYPEANMDNVLFLLYDADGAMVAKGQAELVTEGQYTAKLTPEMTAKLKNGTAQLELIAVSKVVALPVFAQATFVAAP
jgi:peptide/nickel transport system substrate-binding protein